MGRSYLSDPAVSAAAARYVRRRLTPLEKAKSVRALQKARELAERYDTRVQIELYNRDNPNGLQVRYDAQNGENTAERFVNLGWVHRQLVMKKRKGGK